MWCIGNDDKTRRAEFHRQNLKKIVFLDSLGEELLERNGSGMLADAHLDGNSQ